MNTKDIICTFDWSGTRPRHLSVFDERSESWSFVRMVVEGGKVSRKIEVISADLLPSEKYIIVEDALTHASCGGKSDDFEKIFRKMISAKRNDRILFDPKCVTILKSFGIEFSKVY